MAVRRPMYWDTVSGSMKEMTSSQLNQIIAQVSYQYSQNPSVTLSVVASGGSLGTLSDTRTQAGAYSTSTTAYPSEATTAEPSTVTVNYSKIDETVASVSAPTPATGKTLPLYWTGSGLQVMTEEDFYNTIIEPAIDNLVSSSTTTAQGGTYQIYTATSLSGNTLTSGTAVFSDTRADTAAYTAGSIPETLDQPTTLTNFYLFSIDGSASSFTSPLSLRTSDNHLQTYTESDFNTMLQNYVRYAAANRTNYKIRYSYSTGNNRGSGMTDTKLDGSGNYQKRFVNADDYRAQEFPNGTAQTINTYYLKIGKSA